jgi:pimeloyl-ACP methyl ester carboxylesterase
MPSRARDRVNGLSEGEERRRRWPLFLLFTMAAAAGAVTGSYWPSLPEEVLIALYANGRSRFLDIGGARAHICDHGNPDGIPVVLIHGASASLHVWEGWVRALKHQARLILVDLPGHGLTGAWPRGDYTVEAYVDFIEMLVDTLKLDRFVLIGHSIGGGVAWTFAAMRPHRVSQLILVNSAGYPADGGKPRWPTRFARLALIGEIASYFKPKLWVRRTLRRAYADPAMVTTERVKRTADLQRFPGNREATVRRARTQRPLDPTPLRRLVTPTLILWGARDRWIPVADAYRFKNDINGAKLEIFEALGHAPMEEDAESTAAVVAAFLRPVAPRTLSPTESPATDPTARG